MQVKCKNASAKSALTTRASLDIRNFKSFHPLSRGGSEEWTVAWAYLPVIKLRTVITGLGGILKSIDMSHSVKVKTVCTMM